MHVDSDFDLDVLVLLWKEFLIKRKAKVVSISVRGRAQQGQSRRKEGATMKMSSRLLHPDDVLRGIESPNQSLEAAQDRDGRREGWFALSANHPSRQPGRSSPRFAPHQRPTASPTSIWGVAPLGRFSALNPDDNVRHNKHKMSPSPDFM